MLKKLTVFIDGLHCTACEILTEDALRNLKAVKKVKVDRHTGRADIFYYQKAPELNEIKTILEGGGYSLNIEKTKTATESDQEFELDACAVPTQPISTKHPYAWVWLVLGIIIVYWLINNVSLFDFSSLLGQQEFSLSVALLIGLVAGVSTCLALTGGLVLGLAATYAKEHPQATRLEKFKPQLLFNLGRIGGFFILGGLLGLIGTTFKLSPLINGALVIFVGLVILFLGLKLLNITPALNSFNISLPKRFSRLVSGNNALVLGALTFFIPCGFTQAVQIYAIGTGSFLTGGLTMALFALGTAPGLLGIGGLTSLWKNSSQNSSTNKKTTRSSDIFLRIAGAIIIIFALINLNNGLKLFLISSASSSGTYSAPQDTGQEVDGDFQIVRMTEHNRGYTPNRLTIIKDKPVRWIIDAQAPYSCASALIVPSLKISRQLKPGENIIEFTPTKLGSIPFSCSMGMYTGSFTVVAE